MLFSVIAPLPSSCEVYALMSLEEYVDVCLNHEDTAMRYPSDTGILLVDSRSAEEGPDAFNNSIHAGLRLRQP